MNSMAALLAIGVYLAPRSTTLHIRDKESAIAIRDWFDNILTSVRKKITPQFFGTAKLLLCTDGSDRWSDFLNEWESCTSYKELCKFPSRAKEILRQTPITSSADNFQYHVLPQLEINWQHQGVPIKAHLDFVLVWGAPVNAIRILEVKSTDKLPASPHDSHLLQLHGQIGLLVKACPRRATSQAQTCCCCKGWFAC